MAAVTEEQRRKAVADSVLLHLAGLRDDGDVVERIGMDAQAHLSRVVGEEAADAPAEWDFIKDEVRNRLRLFAEGLDQLLSALL